MTRYLGAEWILEGGAGMPGRGSGMLKERFEKFFVKMEGGKFRQGKSGPAAPPELEGRSQDLEKKRN